MSDESSASAGNGAATPPTDQTQRPQLSIRAQFVKDLSFENPHAPRNFAADSAPKMDIAVSVNGKPFGEDAHEVELQITAKAELDGTTVFLVELTYGGVFAISGVPAEQMQAVLMVECPRMLFPFARRVIAD